MAWCQMTLQYYQHYMMPDAESGVMACFAQEVFKEKMSDAKLPSWSSAFPAFRRLTAEEIPAGYVDGWGMESVVINADVALHYLVRKVREGGGRCNVDLFSLSFVALTLFFSF